MSSSTSSSEHIIIRNKTESQTRSFIQHLLSYAGISKEYINIFTDEWSMKIFMKVFHHPTADKEYNYEILEFVGDGIIKGIISQFLVRKYPNLTTSEGKLSKARRFLEKDKTLSSFALQLGFWDYVIADEETLNQKRNKTLEDVYEAFVGALVTVIDTKIRPGLGYAYAQTFVEYKLDKLKLSFTKEVLDDSITRLNELYTARELKNGKCLKWGFPKYVFHHIYLPIVQHQDESSRYPDNQLYFFSTTRNILVKRQNRFLPILRDPESPENLYLEFSQPQEHESDKYQRVRYAGVIGYSFDDLELSQQKIVGYGVALTQKDAKKMAASNALSYFKRLGYEKI